jgi:16S rRNA (cytosine967-C5)-methyltransferase
VVAGRSRHPARPLGLKPKARSARRTAPSARDNDSFLPGLAVRLTATSMLRQVIEHHVPLDSILDEKSGNPHFLELDQRDRALVRAIVGVALRRRGEIEAALTKALDKPLPENTGALSALLHVAAAQILFLDVPDHAAVNLAVAQAGGSHRTGRARGLVNGVLRHLVAQRAEDPSTADAARVNTPAWLFERWSTAYGEVIAARIAAAHLEMPPLDLSVKDDPKLWAERLAGVPLPTGSIRLIEAHRIPDLHGFDEGAWWVQDAAAALPAKLLGDVRGKSVADLCAAPGGKTLELATMGASVTAVDISESRLRRVSDNLRRLNLEARLEAVDLLKWKPGRDFDAVLLDAPCSATGTIRRHPDIPWLKQPKDIVTLAGLQAKMLDRAAGLVRSGGLLVYCTCSLEPEECEAQVEPFLQHHPEFGFEPIEPTEVAGLSHLLTFSGALRTLPCHGFGEEPVCQGMDGFFAVRFRRG